MANEHTLVAGLLPADGPIVMDQLDKASVEGYLLASTTCCAISEDASYYIATLVRPIPDPPRRGISMGEPTRNREARNVGKDPGTQQKST